MERKRRRMDGWMEEQRDTIRWGQRVRGAGGVLNRNVGESGKERKTYGKRKKRGEEIKDLMWHRICNIAAFQM